MQQDMSPERLVKKAVHETLGGLGFDMREPNELQADMLYLRKVRKGAEDMTRVVRRSVLTLLISTGLYLLWQAVREAATK